MGKGITAFTVAMLFAYSYRLIFSSFFFFAMRTVCAVPLTACPFQQQMCDYYLGTVLDAMDEYQLWDDTLLIVNTDHGFLLGEHGWWAKSVMPYYNEIAQIPMFIWDPRCKVKGERRQSLVQNIDVAPTVLEYFGLEPTKDMLGKSMAKTVAEDVPVRQYALFGSHGNHINITDGTYVYMRCPPVGAAVNEYTLMPTHMRNMFSVEELQKAGFAEPFSFTKGCKLLKVPASGNPLADLSRFGTKLYCLNEDPGQMRPVDDNAEKEVELTEEIRRLMVVNDAPEELYGVFGITKDKTYTMEDWKRQQEQQDELVVPGLEGFTADRSAFRQIWAISRAVSAEQFQMFLQGMRSQLEKSGHRQITGTFIVQFVKALPLPEKMKDQMIPLLEEMIDS